MGGAKRYPSRRRVIQPHGDIEIVPVDRAAIWIYGITGADFPNGLNDGYRCASPILRTAAIAPHEFQLGQVARINYDAGRA
jgi:hypothetical protein